MKERMICVFALLILFSVSGKAQSRANIDQESGTASAEPSQSSEKLSGSFLRRLITFYQRDWAGTAPSEPEAPRRIPASPLDSPPFPNADWSYGGAPVIGAPDTNVYPLMQALNGARSKIKVYGWIEPSFNVSTSSDTLFPSGYNIFPRRVVLDQAVVYVERLADTVQTEHVDWGFHLTGFYGVDYRFTTAKGYFSQQLLKFNRQYGFDPMLEYADIYIPSVAQGMNIRVGRYLSIPDIEAQLASEQLHLQPLAAVFVRPFYPDRHIGDGEAQSSLGGAGRTFGRQRYCALGV